MSRGVSPSEGASPRQVGLSARVGFRLPLYGPIGVEGRSLWLVGAAAVVVAVVVELHLLGPSEELVVGAVLLGGAVVLGRLSREGVWAGTHALYRHLGPRLWCSVLRNGVPLRARVRVVGNALEAVGERVAIPYSGLRRFVPVGGANLARFTTVPEVRAVADGLFEHSHDGWRALLSLQGPLEALHSEGFQQWCDRLVLQLLPAIGCPVQIVVHRAHADRGEAEMAFTHRVVHHGPLVDEERRLCGNVAELSLRMRHHLVLMPGAGGADGIPSGAFLHRAHRAVLAGRAEAERALQTALRQAPLAGIRVGVPTAGEIAELLAGTLLRVTEASAAMDVVEHSGRQHRTMVVTGLGAQVPSGIVVDALIAAHCEATAALHLFPIDPGALTRYLERQTELLSLTSTHDQGRVAYQRAVGEHQQLAWELSGQQVTGYRVALSVTGAAVSGEECSAALDRVRGVLGAARMATEVPTALGFLPALTTTPGGLPLGRSVILTTDDVAANLLPALGTPFSDHRLPYVGINQSSGAPVYHSPFCGDSYNQLVAGLGGAGKSVYLQAQMVREAIRGTVFVVLDPKDNEYAPAIRAVGGRYVVLGGGGDDAHCSGHALNPFSAGMGLSPVRAAEYILPTLSVMAGDEYGAADGRPITRLDVESQARLNQLLVDFLAAHDIETAAQEPVLSDFRTFLLRRLERCAAVGPEDPRALGPRDRDRVEQIAWRLRHYTTGSRGEAFDRPSSFTIGEHTVGIGFGDFARLYGTDHAALFAIVLSATLRAMRAKRCRLVLLMDEAHIAFRERAAAEVLDSIIREGRAYGCGVWMASQHPRDFIASEVGRSLAALTTTKVILRLDSSVAQDAREVFDLSAAQLEVLMSSATKGLAVLWTPTENALIRIDPGPSMLRHARDGESAAAVRR